MWGHVLSADGVKPDSKKVEAIIAMPTPANREDLQRFLGVVTYLPKFIPNMSQKSASLRQLLQKDIEWSWGQVEDDTLTCLKTSISSEKKMLAIVLGCEGFMIICMGNERLQLKVNTNHWKQSWRSLFIKHLSVFKRWFLY